MRDAIESSAAAAAAAGISDVKTADQRRFIRAIKTIKTDLNC